MADLFDTLDPPRQPLAEAMRPQTIADVIGQKHLLGPGKPLALAFQSGKLHSMILWGPPGVGKTTLARLMARAFDAEKLEGNFEGLAVIGVDYGDEVADRFHRAE